MGDVGTTAGLPALPVATRQLGERRVLREVLVLRPDHRERCLVGVDDLGAVPVVGLLVDQVGHRVDVHHAEAGVAPVGVHLDRLPVRGCSAPSFGRVPAPALPRRLAGHDAPGHLVRLLLEAVAGCADAARRRAAVSLLHDVRELVRDELLVRRRFGERDRRARRERPSSDALTGLLRPRPEVRGDVSERRAERSLHLGQVWDLGPAPLDPGARLLGDLARRCLHGHAHGRHLDGREQRLPRGVVGLTELSVQRRGA